VSEDRNISVDEALAEITIIIDRLDSMRPGDPGRSDLVARRDELRRSARDASVASRSMDILRYERDQALHQAAEIEARNSKKASAKKRAFGWIIDPGSESNRIDRMLKEQDADEREALERRIAEIDLQLEDTEPEA
jgi:hypothetical protein